MHYPREEQLAVVEWNPKSYTLRKVWLAVGLSLSWIDPSRYKIADLVRNRGPLQYSVGRIDFLGSLTQPNSDLEAYRVSRSRLNGISAFALFLEDLKLTAADTFWNTSFAVESSHLGDVLSGTCGILVRGVFRPNRIFSREPQPLRLLSDEYSRCGLGTNTEMDDADFPIARNVDVSMIVKNIFTWEGPFYLCSSMYARQPKGPE